MFECLMLIILLAACGSQLLPEDDDSEIPPCRSARQAHLWRRRAQIGPQKKPGSVTHCRARY